MARRGYKANRFDSQRPSMHELMKAAVHDDVEPPRSFRGTKRNADGVTEPALAAATPAATAKAPADKSLN